MSEENSSLNFQIEREDAGKRLDHFLAEKIENWSRSRLQKLIEEGDVLVNEKKAKASYKLNENDSVEVELTEMPAARFEPEELPLEIVFEDDFLAVINKPAGMVVHPGTGISSGTLANALAFHFGLEKRDLQLENASDEQSVIENLKTRVGIVHRLDKDTSGLIVVAKSEDVHEALSKQFRQREVYKAYVALTHGMIERNSGTIEAPLAREKHNRTKMSVKQYGRAALSLWKVKKRFDKFTLLEIEIKTGRTHQIRVHLAYINHPIVGDAVYNEGRDNTIADQQVKNAVKNLNRFFLHAEKLSFAHPETGEKMEFRAALPKELTDFLQLL